MLLFREKIPADWLPKLLGNLEPNPLPMLHQGKPP
jgi:hypothetical protein